jgi:hypothetical protein
MAKDRNSEGTGRYYGTAKDPNLQENIRRFNEYKTDGTLGNKGPISSGGGTSFATDRWKTFLDKLNAAQAKEFTKQTGLKKGQSTKDFVKKQTEGSELDTQLENAETDREVMEMGAELDEEDFIEPLSIPIEFPWQDENTGKYYDGGSGKEVTKDGKVIKGGGTWTDTIGGIHSTKDNTKLDLLKETSSGLRKDKWRTSGGQNVDSRAERVATIKDKYQKADAEQLQAKAKAMKQDIQLGDMKERLSDILTTYDAEEKLIQQQDKKREEAEKLAKEKADLDKELEKKIDDADDEQQMMEADADFNTLDDVFDDAELDVKLSEASKSQANMEVESDKRNNPMSTLTDKEKGDFEFKTLEPKDKSGTAGISIIIAETGLDAKKATELFGKLKNLCGGK